MKHKINRKDKFSFGNISENLSDDIDKILNKGTIREKIKVRETTPEILHKYGVKNLPMTMTSSHILENILTEREAKNKGFKVNKKTHYHELGKKVLTELITNENGKEGRIIVLLFLKEINDVYNIKSIYGKKEIFKYLNNYTKKGDLEKLYIKKEDSNKIGRVQFPTSLKTSSN